MKHLLSLSLILGLATPVLAEESGELAVVEKLGRLNGQALACRHMAVSAKARQALVANAPKTRQAGEVFEAATNRSFLAPAACVDVQRLSTEVDAAIIDLRLAYPSVRHEAAGEPVSAEIVTRYMLVDHNGRTVSDQDFRGRFQLITFGYTYCPDVCPTTLAEMAAVMKELGDGAKKVQPIFITVDPARDTSAVLKNYTQFFDPRILGMTGSPELVRRAADNYKVRFEKVVESGAPADRYAMDHSAGMFLVGPDGRFLAKFAYAMPVQELTRRIGEYLKVAP
jgi:protein SCO1/2